LQPQRDTTGSCESPISRHYLNEIDRKENSRSVSRRLFRAPAHRARRTDGNSVRPILASDLRPTQGGSTGFWLGGSMPPCRLRRRKFCKFDYETVHFGVYLNKYTVSVAPFSTPACPDCSQNIYKTAFFCMFSLFNFHPFFSGGSADPICPRTPFVRTPMVRLQRARRYANANTSYNPVSVCQSVTSRCSV